MSDKIVRMNIRVPEHIRDWFKVQADRYSVPYTNYISMLLTQIYENEQSKILVKEVNDTLKSIKVSTGDVTAEEMFHQLKQMQDIISKLENN
jgi:hypothetical protein